MALEHRFARIADGSYWSKGSLSYSFWKQHLDVFDEVRVIARVIDAAEPEPSWKRADGEAVHFAPLPNFSGPMEYLRQRREIRRAARAAIGAGDALVLRVPSRVGACLEPAMPHGRPFGLIVVGDPYDVFAPDAMRHPLRPLFRWQFTRELRSVCRRASAVAYVTKEALQRRYPPSQNAFQTSFSSIELEDEAFAEQPRTSCQRTGSIRIATVGTLETPYKGVDVLIDAVARCVEEGKDLELVVVGDGRCRQDLEARAIRLGLKDRVKFRGAVQSGKCVRDELDAASLFVLASRAEGTPRALIEAMARGLPCIGSDVGGIPELLPAENLVPRGNAAALAERISEVVKANGRMEQMSAANLKESREYASCVLKARRQAFYGHLRQRTNEWAAQRPNGR